MAYRYIAAGVKTDCQRLLDNFIATKSVRFEVFSKIWQEMQFPCLFSGRDTFAEMFEFIEEVLKIAKEFFLPPNNLQTRLCGLYLLYGFYYKQPTIEDGDYLVKIRLNLKEWQDSCGLMELVREEKHYDALYIFSKMLAESAFYFCARSVEYGLEKSMRKYLEKHDCVVDEVLPKSELNKLEETGLLSKLDEVCKKYYRFKCALNKSSNQNVPDQLLNYTSPNIAEELRKVLEPAVIRISSQEGNAENQEKRTEEEEEDDIGERRRKLKRQACFGKKSGKSS